MRARWGADFGWNSATVLALRHVGEMRLQHRLSAFRQTRGYKFFQDIAAKNGVSVPPISFE
jgi:hypothetical protein